MIASKRVQRTYDHRLRQFVCATGDTTHAIRIGVPRSTANGWLLPRKMPVVSLTQFGQHIESLEIELARLRIQVASLRHLVRLLLLILKISGFSFRNCRIPSSSDKSPSTIPKCHTMHFRDRRETKCISRREPMSLCNCE